MPLLQPTASMTAPVSLVTGVAGFIGSHVADELLAMGHTVVGLDDLSGGYAHNVPVGVDFHQGSIADPVLVSRLFEQYRFDYVYHLAAYAAEGLSPFIRRFNYTNNLLGTATLVNAAVNVGTVKCFVFTSSMAVYGSNQVPMREDMTPMPEDPYGVAKFAAEMDVRQAKEMFGMDFVIFRPHNVYGERQNLGDRYRNVIGIFLNKMREGEPMTVYGDGLQTRAFSYITDVAPIIAHSVERPEVYGQTVNVGADQPYTILEMAEAVSRAMGKTPDIVHLEARKEVKHAWTDHAVLNRYFGDLRQGVTLEEGLDKMVRWARSAGPFQRSLFEGIEISRGLYSFWQDAIRTPEADALTAGAPAPDRAPVPTPRPRPIVAA